MELNTTEMSELNEDFSIESKFIEYTPYNSNDPDYNWHKTCSDDEDSQSTKVSKISGEDNNVSSAGSSQHWASDESWVANLDHNNSFNLPVQDNSPGVVNRVLYPQFIPSLVPSQTYYGPLMNTNNARRSLPPTFPMPYRKPYTYSQSTTNEDDGVPSYRGYQLLGDSQLLRFANNILSARTKYSDDGKLRYHGYCVSGQTIVDLNNRLLQKEHKLSKRAILLIGTNDFLRNTDYNLMTEAYNSIVRFLLDNDMEHLVLVTVPPIPKFHKRQPAPYWKKLKSFNNFIADLVMPPTISILDLAQIFVGYDNTTMNQYYEGCYFATPDREDMLHLNTKGFLVLKTLLDIHVFNEC